MRSILTLAFLTIIALAGTGCGGSNSGGTGTGGRPTLNPAATLPGDDVRNGTIISTGGTLQAETDQAIQFWGPAVRFHLSTLSVDIAGYSGQEFTIGGNTYHILIFRENNAVGFQGPAGSVLWSAQPVAGAG